MTIQSPSRRLRLFILSLSLFSCGVTAAQTTSPPVGPPGVSVVETKLEKDKRSPFDERAEIKCLLFADGTGWKSSDADQKPCDDLVKYTMDPRRTQRQPRGVYIP